MITHVDGTLPKSDMVFVFGSNLAGRHGKGAALAALKYGAIYGRGIGRVGQSYAIPTKDNLLRTLRTHEIRRHIRMFCAYAANNSDTKFFITRVGCGLAGLEDSDIAPMFALLDNCSYPQLREQYIGA